MKNISKKKDQSGYVIYYMIQNSTSHFLNLINEDKVMKQKYVECIKNMLENIKKINDINCNFEEMKFKLSSLLEEIKLDEFKDLITKFDFDPEDLINEKKHLKKINLGDTSELNNSDISTKIDKLEISLNKDYSSSTRNFYLNSPERKVVNNTDTYAINNEISNDHMNYTIINRAKMPHLKIGVVITLSSLEIKRIFIEEMRKYAFYFF